MKKCSKCSVEKPRSEFHSAKGYKEGLRPWCKTCVKVWHSEPRNKQDRKARSQTEEYKANARAYASKPERKAGQLAFKLSQYGLTQEQFDAMLQKQDGFCAICRKPESAKGRRLSVDHSHSTNKVRGLLCLQCNVLLGNARDSVSLLQAAIVYLETTDN